MKHFREILEVLRQRKLFPNLKKIEFFIDRLVLLGFVISSQGILVDDRKVEAVKDWSYPKKCG